MPKISKYPDGGSPQDNDEFVVARSNQNKSLLWQNFNVIGSTYTPTGTAIANVDTITPSQCHYTRIGSNVIVSGLIVINSTTAGVLTQVRITLPISSDFNFLRECTGNVGVASTGDSGSVLANTANDEAELRLIPSLDTDLTWTFVFMYEVI